MREHIPISNATSYNIILDEDENEDDVSLTINPLFAICWYTYVYVQVHEVWRRKTFQQINLIFKRI